MKHLYYIFFLLFNSVLIITINLVGAPDYEPAVIFRQSVAKTFMHDEEELIKKMYFRDESPAMQLYGKFCMALSQFDWLDDQDRCEQRKKINEIFESITSYENFNHEINSRGFLALYLKWSKLDIYKIEARGFIWNHVTNKLRKQQQFSMKQYIEDINFTSNIQHEINQLLYVEEMNDFDLKKLNELANFKHNGLKCNHPLKLKHVRYPIHVLLDYAATHLHSSCISFVIPVQPLTNDKDKYYAEFYYLPLRKKYKIYFEARFEQVRYYLDLNYGHLFL